MTAAAVVASLVHSCYVLRPFQIWLCLFSMFTFIRFTIIANAQCQPASCWEALSNRRRRSSRSKNSVCRYVVCSVYNSAKTRKKSNETVSRLALSQLKSLKIRRSANFMNFRNVVRRTLMLKYCERVGRGAGNG